MRTPPCQRHPYPKAPHNPSQDINKADSVFRKPHSSRPTQANMAVQKLYPRSTVKRIVKAHSKKNISRNADVMVLSCHATSRSPFHSIADKDVADLSGLCSLSTNVSPASLKKLPTAVDIDLDWLVLCSKLRYTRSRTGSGVYRPRGFARRRR